MAENIDKLSKMDLFLISSVFHDLGKYAHDFKVDKEGIVKPDYDGHEALSGKIIRSSNEIYGALKANGLSPSQIEYVARCAELHFELGKLRNISKETEDGYTIQFSKSKAFKEAVRDIFETNQDMKVEIGLYFLADSCGKTDMRVVKNNSTPEIVLAKDADPHLAANITDSDLEKISQRVKDFIKARNNNGEDLDERIEKAVIQFPINHAIGIAYLKQLFSSLVKVETTSQEQKLQDKTPWEVQELSEQNRRVLNETKRLAAKELNIHPELLEVKRAIEISFITRDAEGAYGECIDQNIISEYRDWADQAELFCVMPYIPNIGDADGWPELLKAVEGGSSDVKFPRELGEKLKPWIPDESYDRVVRG